VTGIYIQFETTLWHISKVPRGGRFYNLSNGHCRGSRRILGGGAQDLRASEP
jgi:hypothetical protein